MYEVPKELRQRGRADLAQDLEKAFLENSSFVLSDNVRDAGTFFDEYLDMLKKFGFFGPMRRDPNSLENIDFEW